MQAMWKKLDKKYQLCQTCQEMVQEHLQQQDRVLKTAMLGSNLSYSKTKKVSIINNLFLITGFQSHILYFYLFYKTQIYSP